MLLSNLFNYLSVAYIFWGEGWDLMLHFLGFSTGCLVDELCLWCIHSALLAPGACSLLAVSVLFSRISQSETEVLLVCGSVSVWWECRLNTGITVNPPGGDVGEIYQTTVTNHLAGRIEEGWHHVKALLLMVIWCFHKTARCTFPQSASLFTRHCPLAFSGSSSEWLLPPRSDAGPVQ